MKYNTYISQELYMLIRSLTGDVSLKGEYTYYYVSMYWDGKGSDGTRTRYRTVDDATHSYYFFIEDEKLKFIRIEGLFYLRHLEDKSSAQIMKVSKFVHEFLPKEIFVLEDNFSTALEKRVID